MYCSLTLLVHLLYCVRLSPSDRSVARSRQLPTEERFEASSGEGHQESGSGAHALVRLRQARAADRCARARGRLHTRVAQSRDHAHGSHRAARIHWFVKLDAVSLKHDYTSTIFVVKVCADAYLTPCIKKYVQSFSSGFTDTENVRILFMQSDGGLTHMQKFVINLNLRISNVRGLQPVHVDTLQVYRVTCHSLGSSRWRGWLRNDDLQQGHQATCDRVRHGR